MAVLCRDMLVLNSAVETLPTYNLDDRPVKEADGMAYFPRLVSLALIATWPTVSINPFYAPQGDVLLFGH